MANHRLRCLATAVAVLVVVYGCSSSGDTNPPSSPNAADGLPGQPLSNTDTVNSKGCNCGEFSVVVTPAPGSLVGPPCDSVAAVTPYDAWGSNPWGFRPALETPGAEGVYVAGGTAGFYDQDITAGLGQVAPATFKFQIYHTGDDDECCRALRVGIVQNVTDLTVSQGLGDETGRVEVLLTPPPFVDAANRPAGVLDAVRGSDQSAGKWYSQSSTATGIDCGDEGRVVAIRDFPSTDVPFPFPEQLLYLSRETTFRVFFVVECAGVCSVVGYLDWTHHVEVDFKNLMEWTDPVTGDVLMVPTSKACATLTTPYTPGLPPNSPSSPAIDEPTMGEIVEDGVNGLVEIDRLVF